MLITKTALGYCACWWNTELRGTPSVRHLPMTAELLLEWVQQSCLSNSQWMGSETHCVGIRKCIVGAVLGWPTSPCSACILYFVYFCPQILCVLTPLQATWKHLHEQCLCLVCICEQPAVSLSVTGPVFLLAQIPEQWEGTQGERGGCWLHGSGEQTCSLIRKLSSSVEGIFVSKFFSSSTKKYPLHTWITWNNYVVFLSFGPVQCCIRAISIAGCTWKLNTYVGHLIM